VRQERKVPYNGADGLPIREEIVSRDLDGDAVVTRNSYGARCLNVADVLFADVDFVDGSPLAGAFVLFVLAASGASAALLGFGLPWVIAAVLAGMPLSLVLWRVASRALERLRGGAEAVAAARVRRFLAGHRDWNVRLYATPAGLRILALHRTFDPVADRAEIEEFFAAVRADPIYARMCRTQRCFRARVTPKPWRVGMHDHMKPRPGVWPVRPERRADRDGWVARYERMSAGHAACRLVDDYGSGRVDPKAARVRDLHDRLSGALRGLPIA
jgi:hypothetical protein